MTYNYENICEICSELDDRTQDPLSNPNPLTFFYNRDLEVSKPFQNHRSYLIYKIYTHTSSTKKELAS